MTLPIKSSEPPNIWHRQDHAGGIVGDSDGVHVEVHVHESVGRDQSRGGDEEAPHRPDGQVGVAERLFVVEQIPHHVIYGNQVSSVEKANASKIRPRTSKVVKD